MLIPIVATLAAAVCAGVLPSTALGGPFARRPLGVETVAHPFIPLERRHLGGWIDRSAATRTVVYVSDYLNDTVTLYDQYTHAQLGQIVGLGRPIGMRFGNSHLYVTEYINQDVLVFPLGKTKPVKLLTLYDYDAYPIDVAVGTDGTKYVANDPSNVFGQSNVLIYPPGSQMPASGSITELGNITGLTLDGSGNLYVIGTRQSQAGVFEYAPGQTSGGTFLNLQGPGSPTGGIRAAATGLFVTEATYSGTYVAVYPPGSLSPLATLGPVSGYAGDVAIDRSSDTVDVVTAKSNIVSSLNFLAYPSGQALGSVGTSDGFLQGVTTSPETPY